MLCRGVIGVRFFSFTCLGHVTYPFIDAPFCMFGHAAKRARYLVMQNDRDRCTEALYGCKETAYDGKYCYRRLLSLDAIVSRIPTKLTGIPEGLGGDTVAFSLMVRK